MSVVGKTCPFCQIPIKPGQEATTCDRCGISHHTECWRENHGCTTYGCLGGQPINHSAQPPITPEETYVTHPEDRDTQSNSQATSCREALATRHEDETHLLQSVSDLSNNEVIAPSESNKTNIKDKIASAFKNPTSRKIILSSIAVLVIVALIPSIINMTEQLRLQQMSSHGDYLSLESFIQDNITNCNKQSHVDLSITLLAGLNNESCRGYLESLLYINSSSSSVLLADANGLANNNVKLKHPDSLYNLYRNNQDQELEQPLAKLLRLEGSGVVAVLVENDVVNEVAKDQYDFSKIFQATQDACPDHLTQIKDLIGSKFIVKLKKLASNSDTDAIQNILAATNNYNIFDPNTTTKISSDIASMNDGNNQEVGIDNNISQLSNQASTLENTINQFSYFSLHAFMVADDGTLSDGSNAYEIALPEYDYYWGEMPSSNHAILITTDVTYSTKGWLTINVQRLSNIPIQLSQEYGGFTQEWPAYQEVTDSEMATENADVQQLSDLNNQIGNLQQQKEVLDEKSTSLYGDIENQIDNMTLSGPNNSASNSQPSVPQSSTSNGTSDNNSASNVQPSAPQSSASNEPDNTYTSNSNPTSSSQSPSNSLGVETQNIISSLENSPCQLSFFECESNISESSQYTSSFDSLEARYIYWIFSFNHSATDQNIEIPIKAVWTDANGNSISMQNSNISIEANSTGTNTLQGYGNETPGSWKSGTYEVTIYIDDNVIASGSFNVQ